MADETVYALDGGENKHITMTKEQILAEIQRAIDTGHVTGDFEAFIERIKEQNKGAGIKIWVGTQAELLALPATDEDTIYYVTDISTLLELDMALTTLKEELADGSFKVGAAYEATNALLSSHAENVRSTINTIPINEIFESGGRKVKNATNADKATNVTGQINGKAITSIFESDGITAKKATEADYTKDYVGGGTIEYKFDEIDQRLDNLGFKQGSISGGFIENAPSATLTKQAKYAILKVPQVYWYETTATMSFTAKEKVEVPVVCVWNTSPISLTLVQTITIEGNTIKLNNTQSSLPDEVQAMQIGFEIV